MGKFPPNHYQQDIIDWVVDGEGNAVVNALAGTGKTSTLELVASTYPKKMLFLAFNNHIAAELNEKPELQHYLKKKEEGGAATLKVMTVNSLGNMAMKEAIRNRDDLPYKKDGYLKPNKLLGILGRIIRTYCDTRHEKVNEDMIWTMQRDLKVACDKARSKYVKDDRDTIQRVIDEDNLCQFNIPTGDDTQDQVIFPILPWAQICEEALEMSMAMYEERGDYDFVEQLYIPVVKNLPFPAWLAWYSSFVGVDECQDLSALQLRVIKKLIPMKLAPKFGVKEPTRYLFVGDANQAIYAFAGADCHSVDNIKRQFKPKELPLNICYRCAKKIIQLAQQDVPAIEAAPDAKEGEVHTIRNEEIAELIQPRRYGDSKKKQRLSRHILGNYPKR